MVGGVHVAVDDAVLVSVVEALRDPVQDGHRLGAGQRLERHLVAERAGGDEVEDHEGGAFVLAGVEHFDDVRVIEAAQRTGFADEARFGEGLMEEGQELHGDRPLQVVMPAAMYDRGSALPDPILDQVGPDNGSLFDH